MTNYFSIGLKPPPRKRWCVENWHLFVNDHDITNVNFHNSLRLRNYIVSKGMVFVLQWMSVWVWDGYRLHSAKTNSAAIFSCRCRDNQAAILSDCLYKTCSHKLIIWSYEFTVQLLLNTLTRWIFRRDFILAFLWRVHEPLCHCATDWLSLIQNIIEKSSLGQAQEIEKTKLQYMF